MVGAHLPGDGFKVMKVKIGFNNLFDEVEQIKELSGLFGERFKYSDIAGVLIMFILSCLICMMISLLR